MAHWNPWHPVKNPPEWNMLRDVTPVILTACHPPLQKKLQKEWCEWQIPFGDPGYNAQQERTITWRSKLVIPVVPELQKITMTSLSGYSGTYAVGQLLSGSFMFSASRRTSLN